MCNQLDDTAGERFTREDTKVAKGVAILLMLAHHLWAFPDRVPEGLAAVGPRLPFTIAGRDPFLALGMFGKACVPMFLFLAGYGMYAQWAAGRLRLARKLGAFYLSFWRVYLLVVPPLLLLARLGVLRAERYESFSLHDFVLGMAGLWDGYNKEWWFVACFALACVTGYAYLRLTERVGDVWLELLVVACVNAAVYRLVPQAAQSLQGQPLARTVVWRFYLSRDGVVAFLTGVTFARHGVMDRAMGMLRGMPAAPRACLACWAALLCLLLRVADGGAYFDWLTSAVLVCCACSLARGGGPARRALRLLGERSEGMWLLHPFFCFYVPPLVAVTLASRNQLVNLLALAALSLAAAVGVDGLCAAADRFMRVVQVRREARDEG